MTATDIRELDRRAVLASVEVVSRVTAADLGRATPCAGWTLGDLLAHMTVQHHGFAAALRIAATVPDGPERLRPGAAFRPGLAAPAGAGPLDRVVALLGRSPNWPD